MDKMIRKFISGLLFVGVMLLLPTNHSLLTVVAYGDYDDLGQGARAIGMGNAFSAIADDPFGMYYNPAGLGYVRQAQMGADYGKLWMGLSDQSDLSESYAAYVFPVFVTERVEARGLGALNISTGTAVEVSSATAPGKRSRLTPVFTIGELLPSDTRILPWRITIRSRPITLVLADPLRPGGVGE